MQKSLELLRHMRGKLLETLAGYSLDQLNHVPDRFNNNLIWNLAHLIATQESIAYAHATLPTAMPADMIERYANGTRPETPVDQAELELIKSLALSTLDKLEEDISNHAFDSWPPISFGPTLTLSKIDDVATFLVMHEAMHYGNIQSMKHVIA